MWAAFYYDGKTADRQPVTVTIDTRGLSFQRADGASTIWPIGEVRQTQGAFSGERLRLERSSHPGEALLVMQPGLPEAIRQAFPDSQASVRGTRSTARLIAWSMGVVVTVVGLYIWLTPLFADRLSRRVPVAWEESLGREVADHMSPTDKRCIDNTTLGEVRRIVARLNRAAPAHGYVFRLTILRDSTVNAFAMPAGYMVVNSGLLEIMNSPEELAGVLAHEMQHVLIRHSTRAIIREMPLQLAVTAIAGGSGLQTAVALAGSLNMMRYRRADDPRRIAKACASWKRRGSIPGAWSRSCGRWKS